jgi:hypothetical protein
MSVLIVEQGCIEKIIKGFIVSQKMKYGYNWTRDELQDLADKLYSINIAAWNKRYSARRELRGIKIDIDRLLLFSEPDKEGLAEIAKACASWRYQCMEIETKQDGKGPFTIVQEIFNWAATKFIQESAEYDAAPWGE